MSAQLFEVHPNVFLGDMQAASDVHTLRAHGITAVLTCGNLQPPWCSSNDPGCEEVVSTSKSLQSVSPSQQPSSTSPSSSQVVAPIPSSTLLNAGNVRIPCSASGARPENVRERTSSEQTLASDCDISVEGPGLHLDTLLFTWSDSSTVDLRDHIQVAYTRDTLTSPERSASSCRAEVTSNVATSQAAQTAKNTGKREEEGQDREGHNSDREDTICCRVDLKHLQINVRDTEDELLLTHLSTAIDFIKRATAPTRTRKTLPPSSGLDTGGTPETSRCGPPGNGEVLEEDTEKNGKQQSVEEKEGIRVDSPVVSAEAGRVLVHCHEGVSRCSAVVTAFLLAEDDASRGSASEPLIPEDMATANVLRVLRGIRDRCPRASPNPGFIKQLILFSRLRCSLQANTPEHKAVRLAVAASQKLPFLPALENRGSEFESKQKYPTRCQQSTTPSVGLDSVDSDIPLLKGARLGSQCFDVRENSENGCLSRAPALPTSAFRGE
ncbi:dual specificity protein phosphatase 12 [Cystoisospora suis]|uniref:protein-tyrosine-phosphatase n=1 Tax=Cystoisospora suis TaxID=483139 RepID=A0A2C6KPH8_9APIC|nr:dual specificity protein phosphatase 12 [Cystoisospora suis]